MLLILVACAKPPQAPAAMEELAGWFFTEWPSEDPAAMRSAVRQLYDCAAKVDVNAEDPLERAWVVGPVGREHVEGLVDHSHDPANTFGVGEVFGSAHSIDDHLRVIEMPDQTPVEPSSPERFERTFIDGDPDCLRSGACETMRAHNDVHRKTALYEIEYEIEKEWRFVDVLDEDGQVVDRALAARSWNLDEASEGAITILQGYALDVFLPSGDGSIRMHLTWQETDIPGLDDEDMQGALVNGIEDLLSHQDAWMSENP
jgi:hypothetical protein